MISRAEVVQQLLDLSPHRRYLEIGVSRGVTFRQTRALRKTAVDPKFLFDVPSSTQECQYFEITSDQYFGAVAQKADRFDLINLDGLHTFEQTLRDLCGAIFHLDPLGIIVVDDVVPNSFQASLPTAVQGRLVREYMNVTDPSWMGDVFKLVFFVDAFFQKFSFATVKENHGQMILWQEAREASSQRSFMDVAMLSFADVVLKNSVFNIRPLDQIIGDIERSRL